MYKDILLTLFPERCLKCNTIIADSAILCEVCFSSIPFTHYNFSNQNLFKEKCNQLFPTENAFALMHFREKNITREIIHDLKYRGREKIGRIVADWTLKYVDFKETKPDLLIDVPIHPSKKAKRGYNQLHLFTEKLSEHYDIPYNHHLFSRNKNTKAQALRNKKSRDSNKNSFTMTTPISNQHIVIIDDVFTTGNTLSSIAWPLINNNNKVSVLVMAIDD